MIETMIRCIILITEKLAIREIFYLIVSMSIFALLVGLVIYWIQQIADRKIAPKWKVIMWCIFLLALILPLNGSQQYENKNPILQWIKPIQEISFKQEAKDRKAEYENYIQREDTTFSEYQIIRGNMYIANFNYALFDICLPWIWLVGVGIALLCYLVIKIRIQRKLKNTMIHQEKYEKIVEECKKRLNIKSKIKLVGLEKEASPSIYGLFHTKILLYEKELEEKTESEIKYIFLHELAHKKGKDLVLLTILSILKIIHWFNPFARIFFKRIRQDIELKADAIVLKNIKKEENKAYAITIIQELAKRTNRKYEQEVLALAGVKNENERRMYMIKYFPEFKEKTIRITITSLGLIVVIVSLFFVGKIVPITKDNFAYEYEDMIPYQSQYVGDYNKVQTLIKKLSLGKYVKSIKVEKVVEQYKIEIEYYTFGTKETESVFYEFLALSQEEKEAIMKKNAVTVLSLIDNADMVSINVRERYEDKPIYQSTVKRAELEKEYRVDVRTYRYNPEGFMKK